MKYRLIDKQEKLKIENEKLIESSGYAINEAINWNHSSDILVGINTLHSQACISALFTIELSLKAILMSDGINVIDKQYNHNIFKLYSDIKHDLQIKIKKNIAIDKDVYVPLTNENLNFNSFEEELAYISNDFKFLRYEYEKYINGYCIITLTDFIMSLKNNIISISIDYVGKNIRKNIKTP